MESMLCLFDLVNFESLGICSGDGKEGMKGGCESFYVFWRTNGNLKREEGDVVGITPWRGDVGGVLGRKSPDVAGLGEWGDSATNSHSRLHNFAIGVESPKYEREAICNM